jgi:hypothetical protein
MTPKTFINSWFENMCFNSMTNKPHATMHGAFIVEIIISKLSRIIRKWISIKRSIE